MLVELGGMMVCVVPATANRETLRQILQDVKAANAEPLLMQIRLPKRWSPLQRAFSAIYPNSPKSLMFRCCPFMEEVYLKPQWMQDDGIHPNRDAQPFIADWMAKQSSL